MHIKSYRAWRANDHASPRYPSQRAHARAAQGPAQPRDGGGECTSAEHVLPLQQLHDGRLGGGHDDDASVLTAANEPSVCRYVHACGDFKRFTAVGNHTQLVYNSSRTRIQFIKCFLQTNRGGHFQLCGGLVFVFKKENNLMVLGEKKKIKHIKIKVLTVHSVMCMATVTNCNSKNKMTYILHLLCLVFMLLH